MKKLKISIIGYGVAGKAINDGFDEDKCEFTLIDLNLGNDVHSTSLYEDVFFICLPTPMGRNGEINADIVVDVVNYLLHNRTGTVVIKSTITPEVIEELTSSPEHGHKVIYNPEFLTEANASEDFINAQMHIFGGDIIQTKQLESIYRTYSLCKPCPIHHVTAKEASFIKYGINTFLASKVLWFNQFHDVVKSHGCNYDEIMKAISNDMRIGSSHTQVPGFDGKRGYGGACFPKDTAAFAHFAKTFSVLDQVITSNNNYRKDYEKNPRELEQNVKYD